MNFYEQLFCRGKTTGEGMTHFERLFAAKFGGSPAPEVREYTGAVPVTITADGTPLLDYLISGNTTQNGTPTPDNPIMPSECGDRTGNLVDVQPFTIESDGASHNVLLWSGTLPTGTYTISLNQDDTLTSALRNTIRLIIGGTAYYESATENYHLQSGQHKMTFTISDSSQSVEIRYWGNTFGNECSYSNIMLNLGSAPLPYENFGYKIPISSANTTTPVYLGEVETTRKVEKYECTGDENWQFFSDSTGEYGAWQFYVNGLVNGMAKTSAYSNIAGYGVTAETRARYQYGVYLVTSGTGIGFQMAGAKDTFTGITAWKTYLQQQYANGTPVTVWYVLATEETGIVNEPLMKIGEYADTLSKSQAGVTIPTNNGSTTVDVDTTVKPSEVYIKYMG